MTPTYSQESIVLFDTAEDNAENSLTLEVIQVLHRKLHVATACTGELVPTSRDSGAHRLIMNPSQCVCQSVHLDTPPTPPPLLPKNPGIDLVLWIFQK